MHPAAATTADVDDDHGLRRTPDAPTRADVVRAWRKPVRRSTRAGAYAASSFPTSPGSPVGRVIPSSGSVRRLGSV